MTDTINGRTPEEIYKALRCVITQINDDCEDTCDSCKNCPNNFDGGRRELAVYLADAIVRIQQLEHSWDELFGTAKQLERERDAAVEAQPKWISVEERLPDDLEEVLILVKETEFYGQYKEFSKSYFCQYIGCVDDGEWFTVWCHGHRYIKDTAKEPYADKFEVTHWMPLPEAPKEET